MPRKPNFTSEPASAPAEAVDVLPEPAAVGPERTMIGIGDLVPDPNNARRHTPRNVGTIVDALHKVGAARSIVIDENDVILAGNATVEAAGEAGIEKVMVVEADGNTLVAVKRTNLTPKQKAQLALLDNRAAELAEWDEQMVLAVQKTHGLEPMEIGFTQDELDKLAADAVATPDDPVAPPDDFGSYDENIETEYECPKCHYSWSGKPK
jgi:hypothetical protein